MEIEAVYRRAGAIDELTRATEGHTQALHRHTAALQADRDQLGGLLALAGRLQEGVAGLREQLGAASAVGGDFLAVVGRLSDGLKACVEAGAGFRELAGALERAVSIDGRLRGVASGLREVMAAIAELATVPRAHLEWMGHAVTMGFDMHAPWEADRIIGLMQDATRHKSEMQQVLERRTEVEFAAIRVRGRPGGFTFHEALVDAADMLAGDGLQVTVFDLFDWASKPRWPTSDGRVMPLWYFAPKVLGVPAVAHPTGEGVQTTNFYQGTLATRRRLGAWVAAQARAAGGRGHPVMPITALPIA